MKRKKIKCIKDFIEKAQLIHGDLYLYDKSVYMGMREYITIICKIHGSFPQTPDAHLYNKQGCPNCGQIKSHNAQRKSLKTFVDQANIIHNNFYSYNRTIYVRNSDRVIITCPTHGDFLQIASDHITGYGCDRCAKDKIAKLFMKTTEQFIIEANAIHKNKYNYSKTNYIGAHKPVDIICPDHGVFKQEAHAHLQGNGCQECSKRVSLIEQEWLDSCCIDKNYRQYYKKINGKRFYFDGFNPDTNTVYEFYGDYFHGNPRIYEPNYFNTVCKKTFGKLYENTIEKEKIIMENGFNLVSIWECDYMEARNV